MIARESPMRIFGTPEQGLPWLAESDDALIGNTFTDHVLDKMTTDAFWFMPFKTPAGAELYTHVKDPMARKNATGDTNGILHLIM